MLLKHVNWFNSIKFGAHKFEFVALFSQKQLIKFGAYFFYFGLDLNCFGLPIILRDNKSTL